MVSGGEGREDDRWTESSRDEWMDESKKGDFETTQLQYSMLPPLLSIGANTSSTVTPPQKR